MGVLNPSFETGANGIAVGWTFTTVATAYEYAGFALTIMGGDQGWEGFESLWAADPFLPLFAPGDLETATFATGFVGLKYLEDFEELWSNAPYLPELATVEDAVYDSGDTVDSFDWSFLWLTLDDTDGWEMAVFDGEEFEALEGWFAFKISFVPGDTADGYFRDLDSSLAYEGFGHLYSPRTFQGDAATNKLLSPAHGYPDALEVRLELTEGSFPEPLNEVTRYYVRDSAADDFRLTLTPGGSLIDLTTTSVGYQTVIPHERNVWTWALNL